MMVSLLSGCMDGLNVLKVNTFTLEVNGNKGIVIKGNCEVTDENGKKKNEEFNGVVPQSVTFEGESIKCSVQKNNHRGPIEVKLDGNGTGESTGTTDKQFGTVYVESVKK